MAVKPRKAKLIDPWIRDTRVGHGAATVELVAYRERRDGSYEPWELTLTLSPEELACVGSRARKAVWQIKEKAEQRLQAAYDRIITPGR